MTSEVPEERVRTLNDGAVRDAGDYVLYWMVAARRTHHSFGLQRAVRWANELGKPLVVLEPLRVGYRYASDRFHRFVLDGMADQAARFAETSATYLPYVEPRPGDGKGLLAALAARASLVVTDDFPVFFLPRMLKAAARAVRVRLEAVDGNGLVPIHTPDKVFTTARSFRFWFQRHIRPHLARFPEADPLALLGKSRAARLPEGLLSTWPMASAALLGGDASALAALPIDHAVGPTRLRGGEVAGRKATARFVDQTLIRYTEDRNHPDFEGQSGLSPYLHFGQVAAHEVFARVAKRDRWSIDKLSKEIHGLNAGFWNMTPEAEAFVDQLVTWRELGLNFCANRDDYDKLESLPDWALKTLREHAGDRRVKLYSKAELEGARTDDPLWNAAQRQLVREGRIHNYLRMLWGKNIVGWTRSPEEALEILLELNDKYALDGRDPNSYSGIFWVLGRYDRPWAPTRDVFGNIRYMTSGSAAKKLKLKLYVQRYAARAGD